ncbi:MAG: phage terminase large subunit family protein [Desulfobulbaceae bacterium]|nr:phage terminase large subunit family protein [Desulfobulbaceae bacterium]
MTLAQRIMAVADRGRAALVPPFRGPIWEYAGGLDLQGGYAVKGRFDIATVPHLREPLEAIRDPTVRMVSIMGAVQTTKSLIADIVIPYWIEHDPGDILWLFEDDPKARLYAETRAMPLIRSVPNIARMMEDIDRHEKTKTKIKFSHCNLVMAGLNEGNVQSISYRYVVADEAWMARANGLLRQAIYRTTQYPDTKKIILIGQGGFADEDFDEIHKETDQRLLQFACPACGHFQPFELSRLRGEDFHRADLRGTYSGLSWDTNETTKRDNRWDFEAVGKSAHIRCHDCDHRIEDTRENRQKLAVSYKYIRTNPGAPIHSIGFRWPALASTRISFADQVVKYLRAKVAKEELSYLLPMQEFYQKDLGIPWAEDMATEFRQVVAEPYDIKSEWSDELYRVLIVDCQRDLEKFYHSVFAVSLRGEARELSRGTLASFDEIAEKQKELGVKDQHVFLDCGYEMTRVLRECVNRGHIGSVRVGRELKKIWLCWTGLKGSGQEMFPHKHPKTGDKEWRIYSERKHYNVDVGTSRKGARAPWYEWSNLHCKDLLRARRDQDPGAPKLLTLPDTLPDTDQWSHFAQMRSERRREEFRAGKKVSIWAPTKYTRPNHYWDIGAMLMAFMAVVGIIGGDTDGGVAEKAGE